MDQITGVYRLVFNSLNGLVPSLSFVPLIPAILYYVFQSQLNHELVVRRKIWDKEYDYIIIGAGSAGSVMAARLSEDPTKTVLLLEAGIEENIISDIPATALFLEKTPLDWCFVTEPQKRSCFGLYENRSLWPRGRVMGGSSTINTMVYIRGNSRDYDKWAIDGAIGWSWPEIFPYFIKAEDNRNPAYVSSGYHGVGGPLTVSSPTAPAIVSQAFRDSGPFLGYKIGDVNGPNQTVFSLTQRTIRDGERCSVSKAYLEPLIGRKNLHILNKSFVTRILFNDEKRAIGVEFDRKFLRHIVYARNEIILSAGSINSPKILMLSGIGHAKHLNDLDIAVISDLPVGDNLQEHVASSVSFTVNESISINIIEEVTPWHILEYYGNKKNSLTSNFVEAASFLKTKYANPFEDWPDIELVLIPGSLATDFGFRLRQIQGMRRSAWEKVFKPYIGTDTFTIYPTLLRPKTRGWIRLKSKNPYESPLIDPNFFDVEYDMKVLVEGMKMAYELAYSPALQRYNATPFQTIYPGCESYAIHSAEYLECVARTYTLIYWHPIGTCKMGAKHDSSAVVDPQLRVKGVKGLRVVDASVMPTMICGHTNAATVAIAEKISDNMKEKRIKPFLPPMTPSMISNLPELQTEPFDENMF